MSASPDLDDVALALEIAGIYPEGDYALHDDETDAAPDETDEEPFDTHERW
jgi:hypothetical protein